MEPGSARTAITPAHAKRLSSVFLQTADVLERSAGLAEEHAARCARLGRSDHAAGERAAAQRAHEGARRARSRAATWEQLHRELDERERRAGERDRPAEAPEAKVEVSALRRRAPDDPERAADV